MKKKNKNNMSNKRVYLVYLFVLIIVVISIVGYKVFYLLHYGVQTVDNNYKISEINITKVNENNKIDVGPISIRNDFLSFEKKNYRTFVKADENKFIYFSTDHIDNLVDTVSSFSNVDCIKEFNLQDKISSNVFESDYIILTNIANYQYSQINFFTSKDTIRKAFCTYNLINERLPLFNEIVKINGDLNGYILVSDNYYEVNLYNNSRIYVMLLSKTYDYNYVKDLLSTVSFNE